MNAILSGRRGQILGFDTREGWDGWDVVRAKMPESEIGDLIIEVRSATAGRRLVHVQVRPHGGIDRQDRGPDRRGETRGGVSVIRRRVPSREVGGEGTSILASTGELPHP